MLLCRPVGSYIMEKFDIRKALLGSSLLCAVASAGIAFTLHHELPLLFFRAMTGICVSVFAVSTIAAQTLLLDDKNRGFGLAVFTVGSLLPMATVVPLADWLQQQGLDLLYLWLPVIISAICFALCLGVKNINGSVTEEKKEWGSYGELIKMQGVKPLLLTAFIMSIADAMTLSVASLANERLVSVSWFMVSEAVAGIIIRTAAFGLIARFPRIHLAAPASLLMGLSLVALSFSSSVFGFCFIGALFGLGIGLGFPTALALVGDLLPIKCRPKATGLVLLVLDIGWMTSPLIFGFISPVLGVNWTFRFVGAAVAASALVVYLKFWKKLKLTKTY